MEQKRKEADRLLAFVVLASENYFQRITTDAEIEWDEYDDEGYIVEAIKKSLGDDQSLMVFDCDTESLLQTALRRM